ncbi:DUF190 domain-containing protein [Propionivibrio sp.]|uniref:DUF190 domain-containing protein n=1 Tax=Propionivibrio sp. TaxID=2212460 RepID=UPI0025D004CF|nr:DUF190 domain-containing protein [Propionivibrio sp.]MBK8744359.1 DUF190 domain-containing protein [Propionivibrio sp.]MBK8895167.1 DUF190 domain-containing protein [Propionivibrio sp.]MBL0206927.1 DUF190 domain-containing protein [Propionivibrio sp.]
MPKSDRAGELLRIYVAEEQTHRGVLLWEWLLQQASALGMQGGSAFRAIGSFGRHHFLQEARFFELAGSTGIEVEFIAGDEEIERLLALVRTEGIRVFYARMPAAFGIINPDSDDPLGVSADK